MGEIHRHRIDATQRAAWRTRAALFAALIAGCLFVAPAFALSNEEWVSAFVRFVDWPGLGNDHALVVCAPPGTPELDLVGKPVRGVSLLVLRLGNPRYVDRCQIFAALARPDKATETNGFDWTPWIAATRSKPILTIGRGTAACEQGAAICLVPDDGGSGESYRVNLETLARAGLKVKSQLLRTPALLGKTE